MAAPWMEHMESMEDFRPPNPILTTPRVPLPNPLVPKDLTLEQYEELKRLARANEDASRLTEVHFLHIMRKKSCPARPSLAGWCRQAAGFSFACRPISMPNSEAMVS